MIASSYSSAILSRCEYKHAKVIFSNQKLCGKFSCTAEGSYRTFGDFVVVVVVCCAYATSLYQIRLSPWEIKPEVGQNIALSASVQFTSVQFLDRLGRRGDVRDD